MTEEQLDSLGPALDDFLRPFLFCCSYTQTFGHLHTYCRGLLSDLKRKSAEPIALASGCAVRSLQEFLRDHLWQHTEVRTLLQRHLAATLPSLPSDDLGTVGLIDETSSVKSGTKTPGVKRQWCGTLGKKENCVVTVHLGVCRALYKTLCDAELFLPEDWSADRERCAAAGIPADMVYRPKWQIALEELDRATRNGIQLDWLVFDEGYGKAPGFICGLDDRQAHFVGEVPKILSCLAVNRQARRPDREVKGRSAEEVVRHSPAFTQQPWRKVRLKRQTLGGQVWEVKAAQVWQVQEGQWSQRTYWLIWARNEATGEEKYFLSNAPVEAKLEKLVRIAFRRWHVEHGLRVGKSEIGLSHYEGRNYTGLMRHQILCLLMLTFVADHTERLRGEKSGGNDGAGMRGPERVVRGVAGQAARDQPPRTQASEHRLPPTAEPSGACVPPAEALPAPKAA